MLLRLLLRSLFGHGSGRRRAVGSPARPTTPAPTAQTPHAAAPKDLAVPPHAVRISPGRPVQPSPRVLRGRAWVIDGDTIVVEGQNVRLAGIDAPELDHPYGQVAKRALMALCRNRIVTVELTDELSHNRRVGLCRLDDGRDLAAEMVRQGLALDWKKHSGGRYRALEPPDARKRLWRADARQKGRLIIDSGT